MGRSRRWLFGRQGLAVAPAVPWRGGRPLGREVALDGGVVGGQLERTEARVADVQRGDRALGAALAAAETLHVAHGPSLLPLWTGSSWEPAWHVAQRTFRASGTVRQLPVQASMRRSRFAHAGAAPVRSRMTSAPCSAPVSATRGPSTPASWQLGVSPGGGGSSKMHR